MGGRIGDRNLMRTEGALHLNAIDHLGSGPSLWRIENDHRPARAGGVPIDARILLNASDLSDHRVERRRHGFDASARVRDLRRSKASNRSRGATLPILRE